MTILRSLGAAGGLLTGMAAGVVLTGIGIAGLVATTEPTAGPEPVVRLDLAMVMPHAIDAASPIYEPVADRQTKVRSFSTVTRMMPVDLVAVAAPTDGIIGGPAMPGGAAAPKATQTLPAPADYEPAPAGPRHFLQGGYFAQRSNAVGLASELAGSGLNVLVKQAANTAGEQRWLVLVGPYAAKQDALGARNVSPDLLADAFAVERRD